jgi:hypothetical protein
VSASSRRSKLMRSQGLYDRIGVAYAATRGEDPRVAQAIHTALGDAGTVLNQAPLPFRDSGFDAAMAILSDHHWRDRLQGLRELRRVVRNRVVLFSSRASTKDISDRPSPAFAAISEPRPGSAATRACWTLTRSTSATAS